MGEHGHYGEGQTVLISEKVLQFMCFDAKEASGGSSDRTKYGNSNYPVSNIDQWLNSDKGAGQWWSKTHSYDQAPTNDNVSSNYNEYDQKPGFLNGFSTEFKNELIEASLPYMQPTKEGGTKITVKRKVFLPSVEEIGGTQEGEGTTIAYFKTGEPAAYPTAQAVSNSEYSSDSTVNVNKFAYYWLRTKHTSSDDYYVRLKNNSSGAGLSGFNAYNGDTSGVRPLVNLSSSIRVSDSADTSGVYSIVWNSEPTLDDLPELGEQKTTPFNISYCGRDADGDKLSVTATLNGNSIYSKSNLSPGISQTIQITKTMIDNYGLNGKNTIEITVSDGKESVSKSTTFTRSQTQLTVHGAEPLSYDEMPKNVGVKLVADIPEGAKMTVFCCNNGNDDNPTWEDCTDEVKNNTLHTFTNTTKIAEKWGVNIKIVVQKENASKSATIGGFGGVV